MFSFDLTNVHKPLMNWCVKNSWQRQVFKHNWSVNVSLVIFVGYLVEYILITTMN